MLHPRHPPPLSLLLCHGKTMAICWVCDKGTGVCQEALSFMTTNIFYLCSLLTTDWPVPVRVRHWPLTPAISIITFGIPHFTNKQLVDFCARRKKWVMAGGGCADPSLTEARFFRFRSHHLHSRNTPKPLLTSPLPTPSPPPQRIAPSELQGRAFHLRSRQLESAISPVPKLPSILAYGTASPTRSRPQQLRLARVPSPMINQLPRPAKMGFFRISVK
jgi:hypothetical protein